jgi:hypothetical protein
MQPQDLLSAPPSGKILFYDFLSVVHVKEPQPIGMPRKTPFKVFSLFNFIIYKSLKWSYRVDDEPITDGNQLLHKSQE